jgi:pilus assembly protein Flp/PilA
MRRQLGLVIRCLNNRRENDSDGKVSEKLCQTPVLRDMFIRDEGGQDLIEYALVVALIALAAAAGMSSVAAQTNTAFATVGNRPTSNFI